MADAEGKLTRDVLAWQGTIELRWQGFEELVIVRPGDAHAVIARWEGPEHSFVHWYVNLQSPITRTPLGVDASDHILDLIISPDGQTHEWKDETDFMRAVAAGYFTPSEAAAIHGEAERVIGLARKQRPPFGEGWQNWKPDPAWTIPSLPPGWDEVRPPDR
jgi:predicted RNA-binding protein associated with RNAse of E/G family